MASGCTRIRSTGVELVSTRPKAVLLPDGRALRLESTHSVGTALAITEKRCVWSLNPIALVLINCRPILYMSGWAFNGRKMAQLLGLARGAACQQHAVMMTVLAFCSHCLLPRDPCAMALRSQVSTRHTTRAWQQGGSSLASVFAGQSL